MKKRGHCFRFLWIFMLIFLISVQAEITNAVRIKGATRYETSLAIADSFKNELGVSRFDTVILANGRDFADALAGSYLAAVKDAPILMVDSKNNNMDQIITYLNTSLNKSGKIYILGGEAAVPEFANEALESNGYSYTRLKGKNRYGTNLAILQEAGVSNQPILVANAKNFADSLSASATGLPMLLVGSSLTGEQKSFLEQHKGNKIYVLGGEAAVSKNIETELKNYGSVSRVYGKSRYETSLAIADTFFPDSDKAVLAYAMNYPDGLCGGVLAYHLDAPLILTSSAKASLTASYTQTHEILSGFVLGGASLIDDNAVNQVFCELIRISDIQVAALDNCIVFNDAEKTIQNMNSLIHQMGFMNDPVITIKAADELEGAILDTGNFISGQHRCDSVFTITISGGPGYSN